MGLVLQSLMLESAILVSSLLFLFYLWGKKKYRYFDEIGIPSVKPVFLLGSTWKSLVGLETFGDLHKGIYDKLKGAKIGGFYQGFEPILTVRDPDAVYRVMIKDFSHFHDRGFKVDDVTNPLEAHLFSLSGDKWRIMRAKLSPIFTSGKLKWMFTQLDHCADSLIKTIRVETMDTDGEIEAKDLLARFTTDVIGSCVFGLEPESIKNPNCPFRQLGKEMFNPTFKQILLNAFRFLWPDLFISLKIKTIPKHINDFFINLVQEMFKIRISTGKKRNDFVQLLLQLKEKGSLEFDQKETIEDEDDEYFKKYQLEEKNHNGPEMKIEITDSLLTAQAFVFFGAGFETSATSLSFTLYLLSKHQDKQEKARKEVRELKEKHGGMITYAALKEMTYIENCIHETMRLYPPIGVLFRECTKSIDMCAMTIPKGMKVMVPISGILMDPEYYKEPEKFKPERFFEGEGSQPGTFMIFGDGPRICIGKRFAIVEVKLALAKLLDNYTVHPSPKMKEPLRLNPRSFVPQPMDGLWVKFKEVPSQ